MITVITERNPEGTLLGDLNNKLAQDLSKAVYRYMELAEIAGINYPERLGGAISALVGLLILLEREIPLPPGVLEAYVENIRRGMP